MIISWPAYLLWEILASMVFAESLVITHLVPLVTLGGSKDRKMIIGAIIADVKEIPRPPESSEIL